MTDPSTTTETPTSDAVTVAAAPAKPETWAQEAWDKLVEVEQWLVSDLHEAGYIFSHDIWPVFKTTLGVFFSQLFPAIFAAVTANIADPALIGPAVGAAIVLTASTQGEADAVQFINQAKAAVAADPTVRALLSPTSVSPTSNAGQTGTD